MIERKIDFVRKPASGVATQPEAAKTDETAKAKENAEDKNKKSLPIRLIVSISAALLLTAAVGIGARLIFGNKPEPIVYDAPEKYVYEYSEETGSYSITGLADESLTRLTIPDSIDGKPVTDIGAKAFIDREDLTAVVLPPSVTTIGNGAFTNCTDLNEIIIPSSVTTIGSGAFINCSSLTEIALPCSVTTVGGGAFINCTALTKFTVNEPYALKSIGSWAFYGCSSLTEIALPFSVTTVGNAFFKNCKALTEVSIPASVTVIEPSAFWGCPNLVKIEVDPENENYSSEDGVLYSKDKTSLISFPKGKEGKYEIPSTIIKIDKEDFTNCKNLTGIVIPSSVTNIDTSAFSGCGSLESIDVDQKNGRYASEDGVLYDKVNAKFLYYPAAKKGGHAIPSFVTSIAEYDFTGCHYLTNLTIPASVKSINSLSMYNCKTLISVDVEEDNPYFASENGVLYNHDKTILLRYPDGKRGHSLFPIPSRK